MDGSRQCPSATQQSFEVPLERKEREGEHGERDCGHREGRIVCEGTGVGQARRRDALEFMFLVFVGRRNRDERGRLLLAFGSRLALFVKCHHYDRRTVLPTELRTAQKFLFTILQAD